jgi:hypothetical protein
MGNNVITIAGTNMGTVLLYDIDALFGKGETHRSIAATEQYIEPDVLHHAVKGMIISMYIRYD